MKEEGRGGGRGALWDRNREETGEEGVGGSLSDTCIAEEAGEWASRKGLELAGNGDSEITSKSADGRSASAADGMVVAARQTGEE